MKKKISMILIFLLVIGFSTVHSIASRPIINNGVNERTLSFFEKLFDPDFSVEETAKVYTLEEDNNVSPYFTYEPIKFAKAKGSVKLSKLFGKQWAVTAKSMARDQLGRPFPIDEIYVKGSIYDKSGDYVIGEYEKEYNSADVLAEKVSGINSDVSYAAGYHIFDHTGYKKIMLDTADYK